MAEPYLERYTFGTTAPTVTEPFGALAWLAQLAETNRPDAIDLFCENNYDHAADIVGWAVDTYQRLAGATDRAHWYLGLPDRTDTLTTWHTAILSITEPTVQPTPRTEEDPF